MRKPIRLVKAIAAIPGIRSLQEAGSHLGNNMSSQTRVIR
jgi:hypothetical protein